LWRASRVACLPTRIAPGAGDRLLPRERGRALLGRIIGETTDIGSVWPHDEDSRIGWTGGFGIDDKWFGDGARTDVNIVRSAGRTWYDALLRAGVRVYE
jgi:hypothetical protein